MLARYITLIVVSCPIIKPAVPCAARANRWQLASRPVTPALDIGARVQKKKKKSGIVFTKSSYAIRMRKKKCQQFMMLDILLATAVIQSQTALNEKLSEFGPWYVEYRAVL